MIINNLSQAAKYLGVIVSKNSPTILTAVSVSGVITTVAVTIENTEDALFILKAFKKENKEILTPLDVFKLTWRCYISTALVAFTTIGCIIGANTISLRRNAALAGLYTITETAFKEYKYKVVETLGKNKELKIRDEISADTLKKNPTKTKEIFFTGKGEVLCYDTLSGRYFKSDIEQIRQKVNEINRELMSSMFMPLNDLYYILGLSSTKLGDDLGWDIENGLLEMSFSSQLTDTGEPCLVLNYNVSPRFIK